MAHQNVRTVDLCMSQQEMQLGHDLLAGARAWPGLTPAIARAIIRADAREARHRWLDLAPVKRGSSQSRIEDHRWTARARTVDVELVAPDIDEFAGRWIASGVHRAGNSLRDQSEQQQSRKDQTKYG